MPDPRTVVRERAAARGLSMAALSRLIGRNDAFVQQWLERDTPRKLDEDDRLRMAMALDCRRGAARRAHAVAADAPGTSRPRITEALRGRRSDQ